MEELNTDSQIMNSIDMNGNGIKLIELLIISPELPSNCFFRRWTSQSFTCMK